jgi:hypothetical protein
VSARRNNRVVPNLVDELVETIRACLLAGMPTDPGAELPNMELPELLITYGTWQARLIPAQPRDCHVSAELSASPNASEHKDALDVIVAKIEAGEDLRPHLSRRVKMAHQSGAARKGLGTRRDRDLLVADWGIHHLHLTTKLESDGYVERTGDLLFGVFTTESAFLIGIYPHGDWGLKEMLEILVHNWPDTGPMRRLRGVVGLSQEWTDRELMDLRAAGIATGPVMVNGAAWLAPAVGQTLDGTPIVVTQRANVTMHTLRGWREHLDERLEQSSRLVNEAARREVTGDWATAVVDGWAGIVREDIFVAVLEIC